MIFILCRKLYTLDLVAGHQYIGVLDRAIDAAFLKPVPNTLNHAFPFIRRPPLLRLLDRELVGVRVSKQSVDRESILEKHRERLSLKWQVNVYLFVRLLCQLPQESLKDLGLGLLDTLGDPHEHFLELDLANDYVIVRDVLDVQLLEIRVAYRWLHAPLKDYRIKKRTLQHASNLH